MYTYSQKLKIAHAVLASTAWVVFFPLGTILMQAINNSSSWLIHAAIQLFAMFSFTASVALGIKMARDYHLLTSYHAIIGLVLFSMIWLQALGGLLQHYLFKRKAKRTIVSYVHIWLGRALIVLGIVNGGLGLQLSADEGYSPGRDAFIAYGVVAGFLGISWVAITIGLEVRNRKLKKMSIVKAEKRSFESDNSARS